MKFRIFVFLSISSLSIMSSAYPSKTLVACSTTVSRPQPSAQIPSFEVRILQSNTTGAVTGNAWHQLSAKRGEYPRSDAGTGGLNIQIASSGQSVVYQDSTMKMRLTVNLSESQKIDVVYNYTSFKSRLQAVMSTSSGGKNVDTFVYCYVDGKSTPLGKP